MALCRNTRQSLQVRSVRTILVALVGALLFAPVAEAAAENAVLKRIRTARHSTQARIVLELEGARPLSTGPYSDSGFPIVFSNLKSRLGRDALKAKWPHPVTSIGIEESDGSTVVLIGFREGASSVQHRVDAKGKTAYHLIVDISREAPGRGKASAGPQAPLPQSEGHEPERNTVGRGIEGTATADSGLQDQGEKPFARGDALYDEHARNLTPVAARIIDEYRSALRASPRAPEAVQAHFRTGLCHLALGDFKKAEESFKQVLNNHSQHSMAPLAWMRLGEALLKRGAYIESVQALRTSLNSPLEKPVVAEANAYLGQGLFMLGAHREAQAVLVKSLEDDPTGHISRPEILRVLGEAYFANQVYDKSAATLMWYLNIQKDAPGKDLLLAKIGESLMYTRDQELARKVYLYIDKYFPETEGYVISRIRRAEYFEKQTPPNTVAASAIYEELSRYPMTGPMGEFLTFRLASWERGRGNHSLALEWIEKGLMSHTTPKAREELLDLKVLVLLDYIRESHSGQDFAKALRLFQDNQELLNPHMTPESLSIIAESCFMLKLYPAAAEIYQRLYALSGSKNEEWLLKAARCYFQMGDPERTILSCLPLQGEAHQLEKSMYLGIAYFETGKYVQAAQELLRHIQKQNNLQATDPDILFYYVESLIMSDRAADALAFLDKLTRVPGLDEGEPRIRIGLLQNRAHHALKQVGQAAEVLEQLLALSPPEAIRDRLNYELSRTYIEMGQTQKASERLAQLARSTNSLWKTAAEQEIGYLELNGGAPRAGTR